MSTLPFLRRSAALALCALGRPSAAVAVGRHEADAGDDRAAEPVHGGQPGSNIHNDTWMTDAYQYAGPLGRNLQAKTGLHAPSLCGSLAFDKAGQHRVDLPVDVRRPAGPRDRSRRRSRCSPPTTCPTRRTRPARSSSRTSPAAATSSSTTRTASGARPRRATCWSSPIRDNGRKLVKVADYDLSKVLTDDQRISSALPDWQGRIWFVSKKDGVIGVLDTKTGKIKTITLNEEIENSFAVDRDGVYIVSDKRMYRFNAGKDNKPVADWKVTYKNSGITKPSQVDAGSGTTPTILNGGNSSRSPTTPTR